MSEQHLKRLLHSVGYRVFVEYYSIFADSTLTSQQAVERLPQDEPLSGRRVRVNCARRIIDEGLAAQALQVIGESKRVDDATSVGAHQILATIVPV